jgi:hypothetical protein
VAEFGDGLVLDLSDSLAADMKVLADFFEGND